LIEAGLAIGEQTMNINDYELVKLLEDDVYHISLRDDDDRQASYVDIIWGLASRAQLEHVGNQTFFITDSNNDDMFPGETICVDEILDIVL
jgi:hypothetical protein